VIPSSVGIKSWRERTPTVDEVRPTHCAGCGVASRPVGKSLHVHGQGLVSRQVRGLLDVDDTARVHEIAVRRYECQRCGAVMTVVPSAVIATRQYTASSIALALYLWLVERLSDAAVRARICAWRVRGTSGGRGWAQLYRWARAAPKVFALPRPVSLVGPTKEVALRVVTMLRALAPPDEQAPSIASQIFDGAALAR
jgi:hypothetical protein